MTVMQRLRRLDDKALKRARYYRLSLKASWYGFLSWFWGSWIGRLLFLPYAIHKALKSLPRLHAIAEREGLTVHTVSSAFAKQAEEWGRFHKSPDDLLLMWENFGIKTTNQFYRILSDNSLAPHEVLERINALLPPGGPKARFVRVI